MLASTFLIKSTKNSSFRTVFCIDQDANGSFLRYEGEYKSKRIEAR